ncbi:LysM peptidoglycan-binding domain-containing protein [Halobacteroides halobius]|uniref:LysM peptidoglycan-binding domain-containing protein n=1 Tax=Halobacteroides halobius TaxID=42422 RepID=UPI0002D2F542|nr:LysM peptidoglycan-binding domain-containing protein [Halobacteroides halobius]
MVLVVILILGQSLVCSAKGDDISLNFKGIELQDAFRALADIANMNLITDNSVTGRITVHLEKISFLEAVELLAKTNGLAYKVINNTVVVATPNKLKQGFGSRATYVFKLENATPTEIKEVLDSMIKDSLIKVDQRTSSLVVTAYKNQIPKIKKLIDRLDQAKKQVALQARIEEVSWNKLEELGVNWSLNNFTVKPEGEGIINIRDLGMGIKYRKFLKILENKGQASVLANPQITTVAGKEASITIGDQVPIAQTNADGETKVEFKNVGINLKITPQVVSDKQVFIQVNFKVSVVNGYDDTGKYPIISTREVKTNIRVPTGRTIAIGGLIKEKEIRSLAKVPLLGDIPILGKLFQSSRTEKKKKELIIFITPKIITNDIKHQVETNSFKYQVQKGDTLLTVSELFNISFTKIMSVNNQPGFPQLKVGDKLKIPVRKDHYYLVKAGDTLKQIAKEYHINLKRMRQINNLNSLQNKEKMKLVLPVKVKAEDRAIGIKKD